MIHFTNTQAHTSAQSTQRNDDPRPAQLKFILVNRL